MKKVCFLLATLLTFSVLSLSCFGEVIVLFDEDENDEAGNGNFAALFGSHDAGSTVTITEDDSISGDVSAFCTPQQSYNNVMAGWSYSIDDYPYLTFAWKKNGGRTIMLQLAHDSAWAYRYWSGPVNGPTWEGLQLEDTIPEDWMVYTVNLVEDFGGGWNLTGLAFTPWDGEGGYYDHILLHSEEDEGRINQFAVEAEGKLSTTWAEIKK